MQRDGVNLLTVQHPVIVAVVRPATTAATRFDVVRNISDTNQVHTVCLNDTVEAQ